MSHHDRECHLASSWSARPYTEAGAWDVEEHKFLKRCYITLIQPPGETELLPFSVWWSSGHVLPPSHSWTSSIHLPVPYHKPSPRFLSALHKSKETWRKGYGTKVFPRTICKSKLGSKGAVSLLFLGLYQNKANLCNVLYITSIQTPCFPHSDPWTP